MEQDGCAFPRSAPATVFLSLASHGGTAEQPPNSRSEELTPRQCDHPIAARIVAVEITMRSGCDGRETKPRSR